MEFRDCFYQLLILGHHPVTEALVAYHLGFSSSVTSQMETAIQTQSSPREAALYHALVLYP